MIYEVTVSKKTISRVTKEDLVRGNVEVDRLKAAFDAEWDGMETIQAVFANGAMKVRVDLVDGECEIPWEVYDELGSVSLTFLGYDNESEDARIVTRAMPPHNHYTVVDHGIFDGDDGREPTSDAYQNLVKRIEEFEGGGGGGAGLPEGGKAGQMLTVDAEGNPAWDDVPSGLPEGGTAGQVLTKTEGGAGWSDLPEIDLSEYAKKTDIPEGFSGSWNDLTDRPFYEVRGSELIFGEETVTLDEASPTYPTVRSNNNKLADKNFTNGDTYRVTLNGVEYICVAFQGDFNSTLGLSGAWELNNTENPRYPFSITYWEVSVKTEADSVTLKVEHIPIELKTIDEKFLPDTALIGRPGTGEFGETFNATTNTASGHSSHAEGSLTTASGPSSHAEGHGTTASGNDAHAEGSATTASGWCSHSEGEGTIASGEHQHVQGRHNIEDAESKYAHIVGNGEFSVEEQRYVPSNAHTLDWGGNAWYSGTVKIGGTSCEDASEVATKAYVDEMLGVIENGSY